MGVVDRVRQHREKLRAEGLRPVQIWVPDVRHPEFIRECTRQSKLAAQADMEDADLMQFLDHALEDAAGWKA
ncbi:antitoxin MazE family protein [Desulfonatronum thioautotrophicum]|uniref:antitoxin MazE family protein n=1 Tax=Desulfonatronum thioautotrophicum TaxID=617001 RepID=UPI0005EBC06D|nr:antitoxin MazE family protein [Desulfonatronum thioautotrophicum]